MRKKNPYLAAVLNFLLPGIGFVYVGVDGIVSLVIGGILLFIASSIAMLSPSVWILMFKPVGLLWSISEGIALAILGYGIANIINKNLQLSLQYTSVATQETIFCIYCGTENPTDAVFCRKCGKTLKK